MYVTIDPGAATGWSIWCNSELVACGLGDPRESRYHRVTGTKSADVIDDVWIESQVIYPRSKARPADIIKLAQDAGRWAGIYSTLGVAVHYIEPFKWKGQVPKDIHHARVWAVLSDDERDVLSESCKGVAPSKRHNILDSVGLGLYVAKRRS